MVRLLWIGKGSSRFAPDLTRDGYNVITTENLDEAVRLLRTDFAELILLEKDSCLQGELAAVRLKSAAPKVPILLLCDPREPSATQVFFVNLILSSAAAPDVVLRAISSLLPSQREKTGT